MVTPKADRSANNPSQVNALDTNAKALIEEIVTRVRQNLLDRGLQFSESQIRTPVQSMIETSLSPASSADIKNWGFSIPKTAQELASMIDHTLLKAEATEADVKKLCEEAKAHSFATVCVNSAYIAKASEFLKGSKVKPIAVVGFPLGAATSQAKAFEAREAVKNGAQEIDMVINVGELKSTNYGVVLEDIRTVVEASKPYPLKVILETSLLSLEQKTIACALSKAAGAAFVKTSTGFSTGGATVEDITLMRKLVGPEMGVKASGGIRTTEDALKMIRAGANRIGASSSVAIVKNFSAAAASDTDSGNSSSSGKKPFSGLPYKAGASVKAEQPKKKPSSSDGGY